MAAHAKNRAPSAAKRWLSCPFSAFVAAMYPNEPTEASLKGDYWHELMEAQMLFGTLPLTVDPSAAEAMEYLHAYVKRRVEEMGGWGKVQMLVEQRLDIPETGEFGTVDIALVSDKEIEVIDEKSGYVPVGVKMNPQLMVYLLGVIAKFGERKKYTITVHQPNYNHIDGEIRSFSPSDDDIEWLRTEIKYSIANEDTCSPGKHCKETYCPHRGACVPFAGYVARDLSAGWHTSEVRSVSDNDLARSLDAAEELAGYRNELRSEAMRRIMNMDRTIPGYKVVKGRANRAIRDPLGLVNSVHEKLGDEWALKLFPDLSPFAALLAADNSPLKFPLASKDDPALKFLGTAKHVEDVIKVYARTFDLPTGGWRGVYDNTVGEYISNSASGLSVEKDIDGRPAHKRGSEFGSLAAPTAENKSITII